MIRYIRSTIDNKYVRLWVTALGIYVVLAVALGKHHEIFIQAHDYRIYLFNVSECTLAGRSMPNYLQSIVYEGALNLDTLFPPIQHFHFIRYTFTHLNFELCEAFGWSTNLTYSIVVLMLYGVTSWIMIQLLRKSFVENAYLLTFACIMLAMVFMVMNGRGAFPLMGFAVLLMTVDSSRKSKKHGWQTAGLFAGLWFCSATSGTLLTATFLVILFFRGLVAAPTPAFHKIARILTVAAALYWNLFGAYKLLLSNVKMSNFISQVFSHGIMDLTQINILTLLGVAIVLGGAFAVFTAIARRRNCLGMTREIVFVGAILPLPMLFVGIQAGALSVLGMIATSILLLSRVLESYSGNIAANHSD